MPKMSEVDIKIKETLKLPPNTWDPSMAHSIQECARLFYYNYIRNIGSEHEPDYFCSGRAWDEAMGKFDRAGDLQLRYQEATKAINRVYDTTTCSQFNPARTRENLLILLERYLVEYATVPYTVLAHNLPLRVKIADNLYIGGELDKYMNWPPYGLVVGETKTSLQHSGLKNWDGYVAQFKLGSYAHQITHYNIIVEKKASTVPWGTCVFTTCLDIPKRQTTHRELFSKIWVEHDEAKKVDWLNTIHLVNAKAQYCWDTWTWPMEGQKCTGAWGSVPCDYRYICMLPVELHQLETVPGIYVSKGPWAPWKGIKRK